ncbi:hypothetical protein cce_0275 [Crocosphaera subtropica ATCC 51142]|uniref:Uncharacterized protein n=1 Tax=Crocosphaera subtropica (strain ATCC 51142 / BH68) TaxID=43989 RepID=B1X0C5_CROS5|nr:hypothetical protein cce_0275 [Crocosphaera subtropica ATCC 51142]
MDKKMLYQFSKIARDLINILFPLSPPASPAFSAYLNS